MKTILAVLAIAFFASSVNAAVYWTVNASNGILTTSAGTVAIDIGQFVPTNPNPSSTEWESCKSNWIYFNKKIDGTAVKDEYVNRMLSVALAAYKTNSRIRVALDRDIVGNCYTSQIYDQGT